MLKRLDPRQRKLLLGAGAGVVLALLVLMRRRGGGQTQDATAVTPDGTGSATGLPDGYGSTFADNGASNAQLSTQVTALAGEVHALNDSLQPVPGGDIPPGVIGDAIDTTPAAAAPGPAGQSGLVVNVNLPRTHTGKANKAATHKSTRKVAKQKAPAKPKRAPGHAGHRPPKPTLHERVTSKGPAHNRVVHAPPHHKSSNHPGRK